MESNKATIFRTLRMEQNELIMCRFLADLLDPEGSHGLGTQFLKSFLETVELEDVVLENAQLERTCVMTEFLIDNGRRIDIMLLNPAFFIPIEVKINARDQQSQCYDYWPYARNAKLVYLTKEGDPPSEGSVKAKDGSGKAVPPGEICCISWKKICDLLEKPGSSEQIRQYTAAIRSFLSNPGTHPNYDLVYDVLDAYRGEIDGRLTNTKYPLEKPEAQYRSYLAWDKQNLSSCPGLNYRVKGANFTHPQKGRLEMWFRIEVAGDGYLAAGFCLVDPKAGKDGDKVNTQAIAIEELKQLFPLLPFIVSRDDWWFVWRFSNGRQDVSRDDVPNFKTMNKYATDLTDPKKPDNLTDFVEKTIRIFNDQLLGYLDPALWVL